MNSALDEVRTPNRRTCNRLAHTFLLPWMFGTIGILATMIGAQISESVGALLSFCATLNAKKHRNDYHTKSVQMRTLLPKRQGSFNLPIYNHLV